MAYVHKIIKQHQNLEYTFVQNKANSRKMMVLAYPKGSSDGELVASYDNPTQKLTYHKEVPLVVKKAIEGVLM